MANKTPADLPPHLAELLATLPANITRQAGAEIIHKNLFPVSHLQPRAVAAADPAREWQGHGSHGRSALAGMGEVQCCADRDVWPPSNRRHCGA